MAVQMHQLADIMEYVVFGVAAGLGLLFLAQVRQKRGDWDVLFAMIALAAFYLMQRLWGPSGSADISTPKFGRRFPWFRYVQWFLTFPALIVAVGNLTGIRGGRWGRTMATLGAFQVALFLGITAAYTSNTASKIVLVCISAAAYALVLVLTAFTFRVTSREVPRSVWGFVSLLRYLLLLTWLAYPTIWAIGPEGFLSTLLAQFRSAIPFANARRNLTPQVSNRSRSTAKRLPSHLRTSSRSAPGASSFGTSAGPSESPNRRSFGRHKPGRK